MAVEAANGGVMIVDPSSGKVAGAIKQAAGTTGASFEYLLATAKMESDFNPTAAASTSSAKGLFQFIEQTWLGTVKEAGAQFGYGQYADAISKTDSGSYTVSDPATRKAIMDLRNDPAVASAMAGVLTQSNSFQLTGQIGRRPSDSELYMAHFMGVGGAARLINAATDTPNVSAASMFPNAAAANASIFYDRSGQARTVSQVYANLTQRYDAAANSQATRGAYLSVGAPLSLAPPSSSTTTTQPAQSTDATPATASAAYLSGFPDVRSVTPVSATQSSDAAASSTAQPVQQSAPMFRSLFIGGDRAEPVSSAVQQLWSNPQGASPQAATPQAAGSRTPSPLDLFSDRSGSFAN